jgi:hypothetical protein
MSSSGRICWQSSREGFAFSSDRASMENDPGPCALTLAPTFSNSAIIVRTSRMSGTFDNVTEPSARSVGQLLPRFVVGLGLYQAVSSHVDWPADFTAGPPKGRQYSGHMCGFDDRWYARGAWITYFEQLQQLRGMEYFLMDLAGEPPELGRLMDDMLAFNLRWIDQWTRLEYDGLHFADDWGGQHRLLMRPEKWRRLFKPRYAEMFRRVHAAGMDVWFHSDGRINDIFGDPWVLNKERCEVNSKTYPNLMHMEIPNTY